MSAKRPRKVSNAALRWTLAASLVIGAFAVFGVHSGVESGSRHLRGQQQQQQPASPFRRMAGAGDAGSVLTAVDVAKSSSAAGMAGLQESAKVVAKSSSTERAVSSDAELFDGVTLVLPTRINANELPRALGLVSSVLKYAEPGAISRLIVIVPDQDKLLFQLAAHALSAYANHKPTFPIDIYGDVDVVPTPLDELRSHAPSTSQREHENKGGRGAGYRLQMLAKLGVARLVKTRHYVTLDNDVLLTRPLRQGGLLANGRARAQRDPGNQRKGWFACAKAVLNAPQQCASTSFGGVTPAVLDTELARNMLDDIEQPKNNEVARSFDKILFSRLDENCDWTEYALYWVYACKTGTLASKHDFDQSLYDPADFRWLAYKRWNWGSIFSPSSGPIFKVAQGIGGSTPNDILLRIAPHLVA